MGWFTPLPIFLILYPQTIRKVGLRELLDWLPLNGGTMWYPSLAADEFGEPVTCTVAGRPLW